MTVNLPTIATSAAALGAVMALCAALLGQADLAVGIAVSAAVMLVNLGLWALAVQRLFAAVVDGRSDSVPAFLIATKLVGIGFMVWGLVLLFPVEAVLLGGSVVVFSILLHAVVLAVGQLAAMSEA